MEVLWNLEDKYKLSTKEAVLVFVCTAFLVIGLCTATALKKRAKRNKLVSQDQSEPQPLGSKWSEPSRPGWGSIKKALMGTVRWSRVSESRREKPMPLLDKGGFMVDVGRLSHNSASPVWQRPILMGEKCELPRFSGLILYDERGRPIHDSVKSTVQQDNSAVAVRTTLRDLL